MGLLMVEGEEAEQEMGDDPYCGEIPQVLPRTCKAWGEAASAPVVRVVSQSQITEPEAPPAAQWLLNNDLS